MTKVALEQAIKAQKALVGGGWSPPLPGRFIPVKETWCLLFMG